MIELEWVIRLTSEFRVEWICWVVELLNCSGGSGNAGHDCNSHFYACQQGSYFSNVNRHAINQTANQKKFTQTLVGAI